MTDAQEQRLQKMQRGREATLAEAVLSEIIEDHVNNCLTELVRMYRGADMPHDMIVGRIAEIAAMQALLNDLDTRQRVGNVAAQKELGNGRTQEANPS